MKYILTIDEGTTSVRAVLYNKEKESIQKISKQPFKQYFPKPGWVEHDAEEIWQKVKQCLQEVCDGINAKDVYGIGITNQRETIVAWDSKTGKPFCNAIVWQCRRTANFCAKIKKQKIAKQIQAKTGLLPDAYFSATKIKWLLENNKKVKDALKSGTLKVGTIESFLVYRLTNGKSFVTDVTNASRTMLFNIKTFAWDDELLKFFGIPKEILPNVVNNDEVVGQTLLLGEPIKVAGLIGDQQSSLFGQGCFDEGSSKNTYGTGCFMLLNTGKKFVKSKKGLLTTIGFKTKEKMCYALEGSVFNAGSTVDWAIDNLGLAKSPQELTDIAYQVESSGEVYLVPAFTGLGTPHWDMNARAIICGLTRGTTKQHIARAVLESMAFSTYDVLITMQKETKNKIKELHVDGGASVNSKLMQFQAELLQTKLYKSNLESTCLGAVYMTGLATGAYKNLGDVKQKIKTENVFAPTKKQEEIKTLILGWKAAIKRCLRKEVKNNETGVY